MSHSINESVTSVQWCHFRYLYWLDFSKIKEVKPKDRDPTEVWKINKKNSGVIATQPQLL